MLLEVKFECFVLKQNFIAYRSSKSPHIQIAFMKFTSCDN